jgi:hypothetical protein
MEVQGVDATQVRFVEDKIKTTMCRLNNLKKWRCELKFYGLKDRMIQKLRHQLDFLARVNKVKYTDVINDMGE